MNPEIAKFKSIGLFRESFKEKCKEWTVRVSILRINMQKEEMAYGSICISIRSFGILYCTVQCMVGPLLPTYGTYIITVHVELGRGFKVPTMCNLKGAMSQDF